jgi:hypothetical protein
MRGQPVTASTRDGVPARFTWRGQVYVVLGIQEQGRGIASAARLIAAIAVRLG